MATAQAETATPTEKPNVRERLVDTARRVAHLSHEARLLKSFAADSVEDGVYQARRAVKTARRDFDLARHDAASRIGRDPFTSVGLAFGAGVFVAVASGAVAWLTFRASRHTQV